MSFNRIVLLVLWFLCDKELFSLKPITLKYPGGLGPVLINPDNLVSTVLTLSYGSLVK